MKTKFSAGTFMDVLNKKVSPPNCDVTLRIEPVYAEEGLSKGVWKIDDRLTNGIGVTMGGFLTGAADTMMAYAIASVLEPEQSFVSIDIHTTFHRPVLLGVAEVEAKVERRGKKTAYLTSEIIQNGKVCCSCVSTMMILDN